MRRRQSVADKKPPRPVLQDDVDALTHTHTHTRRQFSVSAPHITYARMCAAVNFRRSAACMFGCAAIRQSGNARNTHAHRDCDVVFYGDAFN